MMIASQSLKNSVKTLKSLLYKEMKSSSTNIYGAHCNLKH